MNVSSKPRRSTSNHGNFNRWTGSRAGDGAMLTSQSATGDVIARIPNSTAKTSTAAMKSARAAFEGKAWGGMDTRARARLVNRRPTPSRPISTACIAGNSQKARRSQTPPAPLPPIFPLLRRLALSRAIRIPSKGYLNYTLARRSASRNCTVNPPDDPGKLARRGAGHRCVTVSSVRIHAA